MTRFGLVDRFGYTSPQWGEVGLLPVMRSIVRSNPGEGPKCSMATVTPHPDRILRCDPTSPDGRGEPSFGLDLIQLNLIVL
jgi:hypothetical protein